MQRQILGRIMTLRKELGFAVIFITHDLSLLIEVADTIAVMYAGKVVEMTAASELYREPRHPYSSGLLKSFPLLHGPRQVLTGIPGTPPDLRSRFTGCPFQPRCSHAMDACTKTVPSLAPTGVPADEPDRQVACLLYDKGRSPEPIDLGDPGSTYAQQ
jgi:peptide/nickel transport system ATP-binding protein